MVFHKKQGLTVVFGLGLALALGVQAQETPSAQGQPYRLAGVLSEAGLLQAMQSTLRLHPVVRGKRAEVEARLGGADAARAQRYPSLTAQWASQRTDASGSQQPGSVRVRQAVWAFGRIDSAIDYADTETQAEVFDLLRVQRDLLDKVVAAYARAWGASLRLQEGETNLRELEVLEARIRRRADGELASAADVRLAEARLTQAVIQRDRLRTEWQLAQTELEALTQVPVSSHVAVPEEVLRLGSGQALSHWLSAVEAQNADVLLKDQRRRVAEADVERERLAAMPGVFLQADRSFNSTAGQNNATTYGVVLEAGLDNLGLATRGRVRAALARRDAAVADRESTANDVQRTVKSLYLQRETQRQLRDSQQQSVADLTELLNSYQRQYEAGYKSWLEVLNMQRELTEQRLARVQVETEWLTHTLRLAAMLGALDTLANLSLPVLDKQDSMLPRLP